MVAQLLLPSGTTSPTARTVRPSPTLTKSFAMVELARSSLARMVSMSPLLTAVALNTASIVFVKLEVWNLWVTVSTVEMASSGFNRRRY